MRELQCADRGCEDAGAKSNRLARIVEGIRVV